MQELEKGNGAWKSNLSKVVTMSGASYQTFKVRQREAKLTISANAIVMGNTVMNLKSYTSGYNCITDHRATVGGKCLLLAYLLMEQEMGFLCGGTVIPRMVMFRRELIFFLKKISAKMQSSQPMLHFQ